MTKFIHLSLLLAATAQLPVVSVTKIFISNGKKVTFKFPPNWTVEYCCRDNRCKFVKECSTNSKLCANNHELIINNPQAQNNGNYSCYGDSEPPIHTDLLLCLQITGCQNQQSSECSVEFSDHLHLTEDDCRGICLKSEGPAFELKNNECHLRQSCEHVETKLSNHFVSGDCFSNSYSGNGVENEADLQLYKEAKSWIDALEHCQDLNSSLVQITNQTVQERVKSFLLNKTDSMPNGAWIGLERSIFGKSSPWKWISGTQVEDHLHWNKSHPVDALNHHCGKIIWVVELNQFKWLDACCHEELPFICQTPT